MVYNVGSHPQALWWTKPSSTAPQDGTFDAETWQEIWGEDQKPTEPVATADVINGTADALSVLKALGKPNKRVVFLRLLPEDSDITLTQALNKLPARLT